MPIIKGTSKDTFGKNVSAEIRAGRPRAQALAIAYRVQRDAKRKKRADGGAVPFTARSQARQMERAGMINSPVAGRTDKLPMGLRPGSYVMPADVVSGLGQGNSMAGANALNRLFKIGPYGSALPKMPSIRPRMAGMMRGRRGFAAGGDVEKPVDIIAAGGEFIVPPDRVAEIGGGDIDAGHDLLDEIVKQVRAKTIKQLRKLPGPKKS